MSEETVSAPIEPYVTKLSIAPSPAQSSEDGPIERGMRATLSKLKHCRYPDTFNWGIYDKIAARFARNPPRGGVVFNTTFKLVNHHASCTRCHYSFELDTYGRGCVHNCHYCYAKEQLFAHKYWNQPVPFPVNLAEIRKIFHTVFETDRRSKWRSVMEKRTPLRIGSMSDSFMWIDKKYGITQEMLKILDYYRYPHVIFTRSDLVAEEEYLKLLNPKLCSVQLSISGNNERLTKLIEPGAPTVERRLKAISKLASARIWTAARINPLFPMFPDGYYSDPFSMASRFGSIANVPKFELMNWDFIEQLADAGAHTLVVGFVRLNGWSFNNIEKATGVNLRTFFRQGGFVKNEARTYSVAEVSHYYKRIASLAKQHGIRFNSCYIGNGIQDYFQHQDLWSNTQDCCDVRGKVAAFARSSQDISWEERLKHANWSDSAREAQQMDESFSLSYTMAGATKGIGAIQTSQPS